MSSHRTPGVPEEMKRSGTQGDLLDLELIDVLNYGPQGRERKSKMVLGSSSSDWMLVIIQGWKRRMRCDEFRLALVKFDGSMYCCKERC